MTFIPKVGLHVCEEDCGCDCRSRTCLCECSCDAQVVGPCYCRPGYTCGMHEYLESLIR